MSSESKVDLYSVVMPVLVELTEAADEYLDWAATPGDDECPPETVERLCKAHQEAQDRPITIRSDSASGRHNQRSIDAR
jgi:hypothetical protein